MVAQVENDRAGRNGAETLLAAALAQLDAIRRAQTIAHSSALDAAAGSAKDAIASIRSAMQSGNVDASTLASLAAGLNLGSDASTLVAEAIPSESTIAANVAVAAASLESHATVERLSDAFFKKHLFDADVARHTHGVDLEAFKRREAEDEAYIHAQLGRRTPEGDLNASGKMEGYMLDANAHGAADNPEFMRDWNELKTKTDKLRASMHAAGKSTDEYDKHVRDDATEFLKAKGLSDEGIKAAMSKGDNPLDAVKPYLGGDKESQRLAESIRVDDSSEQSPKDLVTVSKQVASTDQPLVIDMDAMNARLAAAGLSANLQGDDTTTGHGLRTQNSKPPSTIAR